DPRQMMTASAFSSLQNVPTQFYLRDDGHLIQTSGTVQTDVDSDVSGLFQGKDSTGVPVAFEWKNNVLSEYTRNRGWIKIANADRVFQDSNFDAVFGNGLQFFHPTGNPTGTAAGASLLGTGGLQDANGNIWYLSTDAPDKNGDRSIWRYTGGKVVQDQD